jgi:hypothetical protein
MNRNTDTGQMESEDVAAVNVLSRGERDSRARNIKIEDLKDFTPEKTCEGF